MPSIFAQLFKSNTRVILVSTLLSLFRSKASAIVLRLPLKHILTLTPSQHIHNSQQSIFSYSLTPSWFLLSSLLPPILPLVLFVFFWHSNQSDLFSVINKVKKCFSSNSEEFSYHSSTTTPHPAYRNPCDPRPAYFWVSHWPHCFLFTPFHYSCYSLDRSSLLILLPRINTHGSLSLFVILNCHPSRTNLQRRICFSSIL